MNELQRLTGLVPKRPVRPLKPGFRGNRGVMVVLGQSFWHESDLERDLLLRLQFDPTLVALREQPVTIPCLADDGRQTRFTPDLLTVHDGPHPRGFVIETKYVADLRSEWRTLKPRLRAGRAWARGNGLGFLLLTERQIGGPDLEAMRFLARFRDTAADEGIEEHLVHRLAGIGPSPARKLLAAAFELDATKARALPHLWRLVAAGRIMAAVDEGPLTMATLLWIEEGSNWRRTDPYIRAPTGNAARPLRPGSRR